MKAEMKTPPVFEPPALAGRASAKLFGMADGRVRQRG